MIPLARCACTPGRSSWRINFVRGLAATRRALTWAFDGIMNDGPIGEGWPNFTDARFWPSLEPFALAKRGGRARTSRAPMSSRWASVGRDRTQFQQADGTFRAERARTFGIDVAVPLTDTITFVGTIAPDFSNVEVDQQTIAPQEFRRELAEYRPFFAQGAQYINPNPAPRSAVRRTAEPDLLLAEHRPVRPRREDRGHVRQRQLRRAQRPRLRSTTRRHVRRYAFGYKHALPDRTFLYWADGVLAHHSIAGSDATSESASRAATQDRFRLDGR